MILTEAALSFLGAGIPPPQASWGVMISDGQGLIATGWWIALLPGLALGVTVLSTNAPGDWLRDHFDPKTGDASHAGWHADSGGRGSDRQRRAARR